MNLTVTEAEKFFKAFKIQKKEGTELLFCPPFTDIPIARFFLDRSSIRWGAQNVYPEEKGAFTGEISAPMLKDLGCSYVICGHSERRQILGESDEFVARCVGETEEERKEGQTEERIGSEIRTALFALSKEETAKMVIAYEPIWAIGSGQAATPKDAEEIASFIRKTVKEAAGKKAADEVRILYGGSVNGDNISYFLKQKNIDGALIGGASLKPDTMIDIYNKA